MTTPNDVLRAMRRAAWDARENAMPERVRIVYSERFAEDDAQVSIMLRAALAEAERLHWKLVPVEPTEEMIKAAKPCYIRPYIMQDARVADTWYKFVAAAPRWEP